MKKINQPQMLNSVWDKTEGRLPDFNNFGTNPKLRTRPDQDEDIAEFDESISAEKTMIEFAKEFDVG